MRGDRWHEQTCLRRASGRAAYDNKSAASTRRFALNARDRRGAHRSPRGRPPRSVSPRRLHGLAEAETGTGRGRASASAARSTARAQREAAARGAPRFAASQSPRRAKRSRRTRALAAVQATTRPPACRSGRVELVDEKHRARTEEPCQACARFLERIDVMQRHHRDGGVEQRARLVELEERNRQDVGSARLRVTATTE